MLVHRSDVIRSGRWRPRACPLLPTWPRTSPTSTSRLSPSLASRSAVEPVAHFGRQRKDSPRRISGARRSTWRQRARPIVLCGCIQPMKVRRPATSQTGADEDTSRLRLAIHPGPVLRKTAWSGADIGPFVCPRMAADLAMSQSTANIGVGIGSIRRCSDLVRHTPRVGWVVCGRRSRATHPDDAPRRYEAPPPRCCPRCGG